MLRGADEALISTITRELTVRLCLGSRAAGELQADGPHDPTFRAIQTGVEGTESGLFALSSTFHGWSPDRIATMVRSLWSGRIIKTWKDVLGRVVWSIDVESVLQKRWLAAFYRWIQGGVGCTRAQSFVTTVTGSPYLPPNSMDTFRVST